MGGTVAKVIGKTPAQPAPQPAPPPPAPKAADVAPARTEGEKAAAFKRARRGRSASLLSSSSMDSLGSDTSLGGGSM